MKIKCEYWSGFWWWFNPEQKDWFIGPSPYIGLPKFASENDKPSVC